jgi:hypothetical protein
MVSPRGNLLCPRTFALVGFEAKSRRISPPGFPHFGEAFIVLPIIPSVLGRLAVCKPLRGMNGMAGITVVIGFPLVVTGHAGLHADRFFLYKRVPLFDVGVAGRTSNLCLPGMPLVREGDKVGQAIESRPVYGLSSHKETRQCDDGRALRFYCHVTVHTERLGRHPGRTTLRRAFMAFRAFQT